MDIKEDFVDIKDETLHSLSEVKEMYQEKAEQKKAMLTSFTEEEVKQFRRGSPLPGPALTKQMNSEYLKRRFSLVRVTVLAAREIDTERGRNTDSLFVKEMPTCHILPVKP